MVASFLNCFLKGINQKSNWPTSNFPKLETDLFLLFGGVSNIGGRDYLNQQDLATGKTCQWSVVHRRSVVRPCVESAWLNNGIKGAHVCWYSFLPSNCRHCTYSWLDVTKSRIYKILYTYMSIYIYILICIHTYIYILYSLNPYIHRISN